MMQYYALLQFTRRPFLTIYSFSKPLQMLSLSEGNNVKEIKPCFARNFVLINRKLAKVTFYLCCSVTAKQGSHSFLCCEDKQDYLSEEIIVQILKYSVYNTAAAREHLSETFARHSAKQTTQTASLPFITGFVLNGQKKKDYSKKRCYFSKLLALIIW